MKRLYRISQTVNNDYDAYDAAIVCAESVDEAARIHPDGYWPMTDGYRFLTWCPSPSDVIVEEIGIADERIPVGVVLASFNAG